MLNNIKQTSSQEESLYNYILFLSRNKIFYTKFNLQDTFQNRINLIFIHSSFFFIKNKLNNKNDINKVFYQRLFDTIFKNSAVKRTRYQGLKRNLKFLNH